MTTDITELAQGKSLRKKLNRRLNDALGFQRTSGGKHTTISLSIDECKSIIAAMDERLALVEALEKAQQRNGELETYSKTALEFREAARDENRHLKLELEIAEKRIAELESRTVTVKLPSLNPEMFNGDVMFGYRKAQKEAVEFCSAAGIKVEVESWA